MAGNDSQDISLRDVNYTTASQDKSVTTEDGKPSSETEKAIIESSDAPPRPVRGLPWAFLCTAVFSAQFLFALDNTVVADVQSSIVDDLGEIQKLPWIVVAFELGAVSANLLW